MAVIDSDARRLGFVLGLGDLASHELCFKYANGCVCSECRDREENGHKKPKPAPQPWEPKVA